MENKTESDEKPTIAELETMMDDPDSKTEILPNGEISTKNMSEIIEERDKAVEMVERLEKGIEHVQSIVNDSKGLEGWHRNGDVALWDEILCEMGVKEFILDRGGEAVKDFSVAEKTKTSTEKKTETEILRDAIERVDRGADLIMGMLRSCAYDEARELLGNSYKIVSDAIEEADKVKEQIKRDREFLSRQKHRHLNKDHVPTMEGKYWPDCVECWQLKKLEYYMGTK